MFKANFIYCNRKTGTYLIKEKDVYANQFLLNDVINIDFVLKNCEYEVKRGQLFISGWTVKEKHKSEFPNWFKPTFWNGYRTKYYIPSSEIEKHDECSYIMTPVKRWSWKKWKRVSEIVYFIDTEWVIPKIDFENTPKINIQTNHFTIIKR